MIKIRIPTALRQHTGNQKDIEVDLDGLPDRCKTIAHAIGELLVGHPELFKYLCDPGAIASEKTGILRSFVTIFIYDPDAGHEADEDMRHYKGVHTPIGQDTQLYIAASIAGGSYAA